MGTCRRPPSAKGKRGTGPGETEVSDKPQALGIAEGLLDRRRAAGERYMHNAEPGQAEGSSSELHSCTLYELMASRAQPSSRLPVT